MKKNSFVEGTIVAYLSILITKIVGAIYVIPFYNIIGENGGVLYSYAYNIYNLFLNISTSGIPTAVAIIISEYNALKMFNEREYTYKIANKVISIISFIAFLIMFIFAKYLALFFIGDLDGANSIESVVLVIRVISLCLLVVPFLSVTRGYLQGNKYVSPSSFSQLLEQLARIFVVLIGSYVAINVLHFSVPVGVSVALFGTVFGAAIALLYLKTKIRKNKKEFLKGVDKPLKSSVSGKEIIKKIIKHAFPVIIIAITQNIYEMIDLRFIIRGLYMIGFTGSESEVLGSIVVTWTPKICMLINALAIGLCTSIIPFIVEGYTKKDIKLVNSRFNQSINTILFVGIPLATFIIAFSKPVYYIFYGNSTYGGIILKMMAIVSIFFSLHMVVNMMLQGMKKYKIVYLNTFTGIIVNALLDIPMILLLNKLGFHPYLGTLMATLIGQLVSLTIVFISLKREHKFEYIPILKNISKTILPTIVTIIVILILKTFIKYNGGYIITIIKLGICGLISMGTYMLITYKNKSLENILGEDIINKVLSKLRIKKKV